MQISRCGWSLVYRKYRKILDDMSQKFDRTWKWCLQIKLKPCQVQIFVDDTQVEPFTQISDNHTLIITESQENQDIQKTPLLHSDNKETPKRPSKNTGDTSSHSSIPFQNTFQKEMECFKTFTQAVERKFEELEKIILKMSTKDKQSHGREPDLVIELLNNRISALE